MKKLVSVLLALTLSISLMGGVATAEGDKEHITLTVFLAESTNDWNNDRIFQYIADKFNVSFEFIGPTWADHRTQARLLIAAGDYPDLLCVNEYPGRVEYDTWVQEGIFIDLAPYLASGNYPNLVDLMASQSDYSRLYVGDSLYGLPRYFNNIYAHGFQYRADWLEAVGMDVPTTYDELYEVLKAVVAADPDGVGVVGLTFESLNWRNVLYGGWTACGDWKLVDGEYLHYAETEEYRDSLRFFNKLYEEGLLDPDFVLGQSGSSQEKFMAGRAFMMLYNLDTDIFNVTYDGLKANNPDAEIGIISSLEGPAGRFVRGGTNIFTGTNNIPITCKDPERVLEILDFVASPEGRMLVNYGIEGVHYTIADDGSIVTNEAEYEYDNSMSKGANSWSRGLHWAEVLLGYEYSNFVAPGAKYYDMLAAAADERNATDVAAYMYTYGFSSENYIEFNSNMADCIEEWFSTFTLGDKDLDDDWDDYLKALENAGYYLIKADLNEWMSTH